MIPGLARFPREPLVGPPAPLEEAPRLSEAAGRTAALLDRPVPGMERVGVSDAALGPGYGRPTEAVWSALRTFARTEGVLLDPVYTGKAAAHLLDGAAGDDLPVVFLHTGGLPGLFGYAPELHDALT